MGCVGERHGREPRGAGLASRAPGPVSRNALLRLLTSGCLLLASALAALPAAAHPDLDRAVRLSGELDFERALRSFERALDSGTLTRDELSKLLAERALLLHAVRRRDDVVQDFIWLAAIAPDYQLDARAPPDLTAVWDRVRSREGGPVRVRLVLERHAGRPRLRPVLEGPHPPGLVVVTHWRANDAPFAVSEGTQPVDLGIAEGDMVLAYAELRGPGRVVIAHTGAEQQPLALRLADQANEGGVMAATDMRSDRPNRRKWIWIGGAAAVVVAGIVAGAIIASSSPDSDQTQLMPVASF